MRPSSHFLVTAAIALVLVGCGKAPPPPFGDAQSAFDEHAYYDARIILMNRIDAGDESGAAKLLLARTMLQLGDGYAAERYIDQLTETDLSDADRAELKAHSLIVKGKPRLALKFLESEVSPALTSAGLYQMRIWALRETGDLAKDTAVLVEALQAYPGSPDLHALAGRYYQSTGEWEFAEEGVRRALSNDPDHYEAQLLDAELAIRRGDLEAALTRYQSIAEKYPGHAIPVVNVAGLQLDLGRTREAEATLKSGLTVHPGFDLLNYQKARLEFKKGEYEEAARTLDRMVMRVEDYTPALILSSKVALKLGNRELATVQLLRASRKEKFAEEANLIMADYGLD
ncbi:tetratricopeptide repeat protein [Pontixanthobacter aestiaquae]|uniref:Tetratricopeptide repeat protein n=1 Tax=Pontixanthobacter aestiaquae TaxID=1509367 RepID=A0A844Z5B8_9SPHN|nr:tetratricopeptide repeat protein [Pontixanthobacter aestiaquae]MDN3647001.1 tetratricopeptide repeat protein [Pontixanthobacter aestiaquae]MXO82020.1 tetratricopeptide repeat protein [Pontixanthobacter aestiaquae]